MALRDQKEYAAAFEQASDTTAPMFETPEIQPEVKAPAKETKAVATQKPTATAVSTAVARPKFTLAHAEAKDVFDTQTVAALSRATPRITAEQGALCKDRTTDLGKTMVLELISWNTRLAIGCGEDKMNDEQKKLFRVSYTGDTIDGEEDVTVAEYIAQLKAQGYPKAKATPYGDLFGYIVESNGKEVPEEDRELVLVQASQTSFGNFTSFCASRGILESRGSVKPSSLIQITAEAKSNGTNKYTNLSFAAVKAR
jgi:hypothetical protein